MPKVVYSVTINGRVEKRKSERTYTHAVIAIRNEERSRERAYSWCADDQENAEHNFRFLEKCVDGSWYRENGWEVKHNEHDAATVVAGFEAYLAGLKADKIKGFEDDKAKGGFVWRVVAWAGSQKLAEAQVRTLKNRGYYLDVKAVPAGANLTLHDKGGA